MWPVPNFPTTGWGDGHSSSPTSWSLNGGKVGPLLGAIGAE
jgi:hypothetical protein